MVHGNSVAPARMFLVELVKGRVGELRVEPPLMVRGEDGGYSEEKLRIFRGRG
jgi:tRNA1Val (adenine37-N6)-methyltransferase